MNLLSVFLIGVSLSMDAFAVSISSAVCIRKIKVWQAAKIALFFGVFQAAMPTVGYFLGRFFAGYVESVSAWVAFVLLAFIGGKMLYEAIRSENKAVDCKTTNPLDTKVLAVLAVATSIDALAVGISFAFLTDVHIWSSVALIGAVTFTISFIGVYLGKKTGDLLGKKAEILGGIILIGIGVKILLEYLLK